MRIRGAKRGLAVDTVTYTGPYLDLFKRLGIRTVFRYLNYHKEWRDTPCTDPRDWFKSCSRQELLELLTAGFDVGIMQRGIGKRNAGGMAAGEGAGEAAVHNAQGIGIPAGASILIDCEWSDPPDKGSQRAYIEAHARRMAGSGYRPTQYVTTDLRFTSAELYSLRWVKGYVKSASSVPAVDVRGYQSTQSLECWITTDKDDGPLVLPWSDKYYRAPRPGIRCDLQLTTIDGLGDRYQIVAP